MSDITSRWNGNYYLTEDQYEGANKYFETKINSPNSLNTFSTTSTDELTGNPPYTISSKSCGSTCVSNIVGEYIGVIFHNLEVKRIIFNPPATVVFWEDDTKTVVKCSENDEFNPEIGVAMCFMKKIYGSRHAFSKMVEKYITEGGDTE